MVKPFEVRHTASELRQPADYLKSLPGVNALFSSPACEDSSQKWVDFAASFWHLDCVRSLNLVAFSQRYQKWCKRHGYKFSSGKAAELHEGAKNQIAMLPKDAMTKLLIYQTIEQLNAASKTVELLRTEMNRLAEQLPGYPVVMAMGGANKFLRVYYGRVKDLTD